jgi:D-sedoheptulose 7-phosphate isomerase
VKPSAQHAHYARQHLAEAQVILQMLDCAVIERLALALAEVKAAAGRLFFLGVGGSAANCSHAVNDFRKLVGIECYAATDNVAELTARINDEGWDGAFVEWLKVSRLNAQDAVFVLSVGGGNLEQKISVNLVEAGTYAKRIGAKVLGILGRDGGHTARLAEACVIIPTVNPQTVTPHCEAFQAVIWHLLVSHPLLRAKTPKWEAVQSGAMA